ncbi:penicillin-binding protein [Robertmurraya yapensis]|uniref:serine-type D-Ala-D-Ala carboxypeptidase n=1 Tax=Bacillus yapensis TaxID=2492960 RepID=A0A431WAC4_9BACI|nr:penicillin-binding protein [Bacillus yapensis]RTR32453.1 penicillin-binding protein [Bacillus yapensis]TKS96647.1 PASTA domain-containing protein [Bacillus yapensis]
MIRKQPNMNVGAALLFVIFCLLFFVLIFRFVSIQVTGEAAGQPLAAKAQKNYNKQGILEAKRGTIYDRNGEVIAEDTSSYTIVAILDKKMKPNYVADKEKTAAQLSKYIDLSESEIYRILSKKDLFQVEFGRAGKDISLQTKSEIEELELPGITFVRESKRFYPNGIFSSHLIGYVDTKDGETTPVGQLGIEKSLNDILTGKNGSIQYESDLWGYLLPNSEEKITPAQNGKDVYLTLDKKIQTFLEDALNQAQEQYSPKKMVAIVADPATGEILAMGQRPTFHPKTREGITDTWLNEAVEVSFEPGSTMKVFTLAAALEENVLNLNETYQSGSYKVTKNSPAIRDHNKVGWGPITYLEGIQRSSNVAIAKIVNEKLGFDTYREYLTKFGFEDPTGIEIPNETGGNIVYNYPLDKITTGYGQGTAITAIQQIQAATAIAGNGTMLKPHIIERIVDPNTKETVEKTKPETAGKPISEDTAKKVREVLETVISSPKGTGHEKYNIEGYEVAGKTGTANFTENGAYLHGEKNYVFSFLGMAPADNPQLIVYVAVQQPDIEVSSDGSKPVSMIFKQVMKNSLQYLSIQPSETEASKTIDIPDVTGKSVEQGVGALNELGANPVVLGNGTKIDKQLPEKGQSLLEGEKVVVLTDGEITLPDMTGWSLRDVMKVANLANLELNVSGSGYVTKQNLQVGTALKDGDYLVIHLQKPDQVAEEEVEEEVTEGG